MKSLSQLLLMTLLLATIALQPLGPANTSDGLDETMEAFIQAVRSRNSPGVLAGFSRSTPWRYVSYTIGTNHVYRKVVDYGKVARDFKAHKGWYEFFMIDTTEGTERPLGSRTPTKWHRRGLTFVVYPDEPKAFYIKWRQERDKWVIAEIGESRD